MTIQLSTQTIVISVIAIVLISLGTGFAMSKFSTLSGSAIAIQEQVRNQIIDDLQFGKKLVVPYRTLHLDQGGSEDVLFGVYNEFPALLKYTYTLVSLKKTDSGDTNGLEFLYYTGPYTLQRGESGLNVVRIDAKQKGRYLVQVSILADDEEYARQTFFVDVS